MKSSRSTHSPQATSHVNAHQNFQAFNDEENGAVSVHNQAEVSMPVGRRVATLDAEPGRQQERSLGGNRVLLEWMQSNSATVCRLPTTTRLAI